MLYDVLHNSVNSSDLAGYPTADIGPRFVQYIADSVTAVRR